MNLFWKGAAALSLTVAGLGAATVPAQAQYYGGGHHGWRDGRDGRWDDRRWDNRRWDDRRHWRGDRRDWRGYRGYNRAHYRYRTRCWTEWRYDYYRDRDVRVRICR
ncbi:hypothetical protein Q4610_18070 [Sphingobium sp. HBC34]|uniref:Uncharacterized protein n=1 Tax=Sphingobium cyanobacteriorum TaxID=3063954 RepID=A0ABT8ZR64_9SPHN|nr:hypothetical protein [Sphingobium sp. HBC34]MDO7836958.1 hypothetical protein [Sphingobium sp. HBC34]